ncbi:hypothetical protein D3C75_904410 [compost metagenome]
MVFVPLHHPDCPFHKGFLPIGMVGQGMEASRLPGAGVHHTVAFQIRLVHHIEAVLVAQVEEPGIIGIVGGADGVDIMRFHHIQVLDHVVQRDGLPKLRMGVMTVHTLQLDRFAVHGEDPVLDLHFLEAGLKMQHLSAR